MIDIELVRSNFDRAEELIKKRGRSISLRRLAQIDRDLGKVRKELEDKRAERNRTAALIGQSKRTSMDIEQLQNLAKSLKEQIVTLEKRHKILLNDFNEEMYELPNIPAEVVPIGGKESNVCIKAWGKQTEFADGFLSHTDLCLKHKLVDFERGVKLGGSGYWIYTGIGAALEWSLINYFCSKHYSDGYTFILPPHILRKECGFGAGQFPKFIDDVFFIDESEGEKSRYLLPTSETALLNLFRDEIILEDQLPIKLFSYTPCYRKEAGGTRADERGTVRGHQFNKVEMFQFTTPVQAEQGINELIRRAESLLEELGLHYRTVLLAAEDTSASMSLTYDVEVWIPSIGQYKEVSSISCAGDYQARRAKIRYRAKKEDPSKYVYTLNASGLATSRLLPAIIEQFQQSDNSIVVPVPLRTWIGKDKIG